ncbi:9609_t:CDS:2 [Paraglomus brasilianum]|uniref:9609_t:CDS:1 n=1 Tax=Paraglomus brasilianum TaxID=144538 RepID=A0A9N8VFS8_9GLOM|nr:9609_t:CDS:2 [Paraglomus brasilianum]
MSNTHEDVLKDTTHPPIVQHRDPPNSETGTCTEKQIQADNIKIKEYEKPSYIHGAKDALTGTVKENVARLTGNEETKQSGHQQKQKGLEEIENSVKEDEFDDAVYNSLSYGT